VTGVQSTGGNFIDTSRGVCVQSDQRTDTFPFVSFAARHPFDRTRVTFVGRPLSAPRTIQLFGVVELTHR
jgi:hypothetical protein